MPPPSDAPAPQPKSGVPGWAKWAIGCGAMVMCCCPVGGGILFPVMKQARQAANSAESMSHLKQLTAGWMMYSTDYDDKTCSPESWNDKVVKAYSDDSERMLQDPLLATEPEKRGYGLNAGTGSTLLGDYEDETKVIVFGITTKPGKDALITPNTLRKASNFPFRTLWTTANGMVKKALIDEAQRLQWKPVLMKK